ncbi:hypothetical protein CTI12_AA455340 [Artemisia annua]|uniref:Uncharacterized protein n=1 Tax=Artemisia annua TaxID=35608 RepID=A0A2U1LTQ2_ARTAN|nr:hypothetical protein CTI12_AA455340 [Artemisia annua]
MDAHPTPFPGNKAQSVKSKYKKVSEAPKQKIKEALPQRQRRTFGTIRNPNIPEKTLPEKPKPKPTSKISSKPPKTEVAPKPESAKKTPKTGSDTTKLSKKKTVSFTEKVEGSVTKKSPAREADGVKTPIRPPFTVKPIKVSGTPYLSAEKCSSCLFDRLETASYWLGQIKTAESVGKHFVSAGFFRLANDCKAEPIRNLQIELKKYMARHDNLSTKAEWEDVARAYGILKKEHEAKSNEDVMNLSICDEMGTPSGSKLGDVSDAQESGIEDDDWVKEIDLNSN